MALPNWLNWVKKQGEQTPPLRPTFNDFTRSLQSIADVNQINADGILQNATAFSAIDTIAKSIAQQSFQVRENGVINPDAYPQGMLDRPNQNTTSYEAKYQIIIDMMTYGKAFVETRRARGEVRSWRVIPPPMIRVGRDVNGDTVLQLEPTSISNYQINNVIIENVTMIRDISSSKVPQGLARHELLRSLVSLDNAIDRFANTMFSRSLQLGSHVLLVPDALPEDQVDKIIGGLQEQFAGINSSNANAPAVLEGGITVLELSPIKPTDAEMSALKTRTSAQITAAFGVPAALIELSNGTANYNNVSQRYAGFYRDTIGPISINIQEKLTRAFGLPPTVEITLDSTELLKGDYQTQVNVATSGFRNGYWTLNEARDYVGLTLDEEMGDNYLHEIQPLPTNTAGTSGDQGVDNEESGIPNEGDADS